MKTRLFKPLCGAFLIALATLPQIAVADVPYDPPYDFDWSWTPDIPTPIVGISPLCGDVVTVSPSGWMLGDHCPWTQWNKADRIVSTYGPRKQSDNFDFHRGVDYRTVEMELDNAGDPTHITPINNPRPVFAVAAGEFVDWDYDSDDGYLVIVSHRNQGVYTRYKHLSSVTPVQGLSQGDPIFAGQYLGLTGRSESGNHHLHFEVRKVTPDGDTNVNDEKAEASWKRNAVHPLRFVPYYPPKTPTAVTVLLDSDGFPTVDVDTDRWDVRRVSLSTCVWNPVTQHCYFPFFLPGSIPVDGYHVNPPFSDFELASYQYTHRGPSQWQHFQLGEKDECPYADDPDTGHLLDYDGDRHLTRDDTTEHTFNGIKTEVFGSSTYWHRIFHFEEAQMWSSGCARATVSFVKGGTLVEDFCW